MVGNGFLSLRICSFHCKLMIVVLFPPRNGQIWGRKQVYKLGKVVICPQYRPLMRSFQEGEEECLRVERREGADVRMSRFQDFKMSRFQGVQGLQGSQDFQHFQDFQDFQDFKISRFQDFKIFKIFKISRFQDFKISFTMQTRLSFKVDFKIQG